MVDLVKILRELILVPGVSGYEDSVRQWLQDTIKKLKKNTEFSVDNLGNLHIQLSTGPKTIVIMAHMDELGLVVIKVEDDGSLRFRKIGGIDDRTLVGRVVEIKTAKGIIPGVIGLKPPHLITDKTEMQKTIAADELFVDIGSRSKKESHSMGIEILDPMVLKKDFIVMNGKYISARGLDDRCGCAVLVDLFNRLKNVKLKNGVTLVFSVQEETGLRGAIAAAHALKPDIIFAVDSLTTTDGPGLPRNVEPIILGNGPALRLIDNRAMASPVLRDFLVKLAKKKRIPLQLGVSGGTTDGAAVQELGAAMMPVCIPLRYTHSPVEVIHHDDMVNLTKLLIEAVQQL